MDSENEGRILIRSLGLRQVKDSATFGPLTTCFHQLHALTTLKDAALGAYGAAGILETAMLGHD